jgi:hypothetical protein
MRFPYGELESAAGISAPQLFPDYATIVVPFFGTHEITQRAFAEYLVTGDPFDLPREWGVDSFALVARYGNMDMIPALMLAELVRASRRVKKTRKGKGE